MATLSQAAVAQNSSTYNTSDGANNGQPSAHQADNQNDQNLPQELRNKLTEAGFTDVKVVPSSFFVTAKSKDGQDVMMRISPSSMTMLTELPADRTSTTGGGSNSTNDSGASNTNGANSSGMSNDR